MFRVNVAPEPCEPRDNITPPLGDPSNSTPRTGRLTEDVKDTTIIGTVSGVFHVIMSC